MTTPPTQATRMTTTHGMARQQRQQQFPPPPPYSPTSTLAVACSPNPQHRHGPPQQQNNRHGATSEKQKHAVAQLAVALQDFKVYKRALGTTLFCAIYYIFYLLLTLCIFRGREIIMFVAILDNLLLFAVAGVLAKKGVCLLPMFVLFLLLFTLYMIIFKTTIFALIAGHPQWWKDVALLPAELIYAIDSISNCLGLKPCQMAIIIALASFVCCFASGYIATEVLTAMLCMPKYCQELHQMALNMLGSTTNLSDPALIAHLRKHINERAKKPQQIRV